VVCHQQGGYRCAWSHPLNGAHHSGYLLVAVTADNYRLGKIVEVAQAAPASPASSLSPLWYISIAAVVVIAAIVVAALRATPGNGYSAVTVSSAKAVGLATYRHKAVLGDVATACAGPQGGGGRGGERC
jgi:hypothetical protein